MNECKHLKGRMLIEGDTQKTLADYLGISESNFNSKVNGKNEFTRNEMRAIIERYNLTDSDIRLYFFS